MHNKIKKFSDPRNICKFRTHQNHSNNQMNQFMKVRELIGKITLQENISPIERNKVNGSFVIHIPNPLASYYSRFTEVNRPNSIVLVTKDPVSFEKILRATSKINQMLGLSIHGAKCELMIGRHKYSGIRLMDIDRYTKIEMIQKAYQEEGFNFHKNVKLETGTDALIRVNKFFNIIDVDDHIYQSPNNRDRFYFDIPRDVEWEEFREMTFDIKNNVAITNFDIAKGIFYEKDGITDVIRVIKPGLTLDMVKTIRQKYLEKFE